MRPRMALRLIKWMPPYELLPYLCNMNKIFIKLLRNMYKLLVSFLLKHKFDVYNNKDNDWKKPLPKLWLKVSQKAQ